MTDNKDGTVTMTEDEIGTRADHDYQLGISAGWIEASRELLAIATEKFLACDDDAARSYRSLAQRLKETGDKKHPKGTP